MSGRDYSEQACLVALLQTRPKGLSWPEISAEVLEAGSASAVWERYTQPALVELTGDSDTLAQAAANLTRWRESGLTVLTVLDKDYPAQLRDIHQAPPILFARGALVSSDRAVSVVGSRRASERGLSIASRLSAALVDDGVTVVSGLALGIDSTAHKATLEAGGRTVAVIGTGINKAYPAENRDLQEAIASQGLVISQFWPEAPPQRHNFIMRNATMSGYGIATVVVEAGETSGARAQARMAVEHGRPVILTDLVVERNQWAQQLRSRPGVHVARSIEDVLSIVAEVTKQGAWLQRKLEALVPNQR